MKPARGRNVVIPQLLNCSIPQLKMEQPSGGREGCPLTGFGRSKVDLKKGGKRAGEYQFRAAGRRGKASQLGNLAIIPAGAVAGETTAAGLVLFSLAAA